MNIPLDCFIFFLWTSKISIRDISLMQKINSIMPVPIGREWEEQGVSKEVKIISKERKTLA